MRPPRRHSKCSVIACLFLGSASAAQAQVFEDRAAFKAAAGSVKTTDFENLVGKAEFPVNHRSAVAHVATDHGITIDAFNFDGGSAEFGEENYLFAANTSGGQYSLDGSAAAVSGRTFVTLRTNGARSFGFDFGVDRVQASTFSLTFTFYRADGSREAVTRTGSSGAPQFLGYVGAPIDRIDIVNDTPAVGGYRPYFVFDNVMSALAGPPLVSASDSAEAVAANRAAGEIAKAQIDAVEAAERTAKEKYEADLAANAAANAAARAQYEAQLDAAKRANEAVTRAHEAAVADWQRRVAACKAGNRAACAPN